MNIERVLSDIDSTVQKLDALASVLPRTARVVSAVVAGEPPVDRGPLGAGAARIWTNCQTLKSALRDVKHRLLVGNRRAVRTLVLERPTHIVSVAQRTRCTTAEVLALNPAVNRARVLIPAQTVIRYYGVT
jgi:hypothetical protein